jgi:hypothetical protein
LLIYVKIPNIIEFITIDTSPKDNIKKGKLSIFNIGLTVIFISPRIIHHTKNVFQASREFGEQLFKHHKVIQFSIHSFEFSQSKITITYNIKAFNIIEKSIFIRLGIKG